MMNRSNCLSLLLPLALSFGCSNDSSNKESPNGDQADARVANPEGSDAGANDVADAKPQEGQLPSWSLEDIQPKSPRFGETYGLNAFPEQILVVVLVEGF